MKLLVMSALLAYALAQDFQVQYPDIDVPLMAEILHHLRCTFFLQGNIRIEDLSTHVMGRFFHQPYTHTHNSGLEKDAIQFTQLCLEKFADFRSVFLEKNQTWPPK